MKINVIMTAQEFAKLPYRDDIRWPVDGQSYRAKAYPRNVFIYHGPDHRPTWDCFAVDIYPKTQTFVL